MRLGRLLWLLGSYNVIQNLLLPKRWYVRANFCLSAFLVALARGSGISWAEMGLNRSQLRDGMRLGIRVSSLAAVMLPVAMRSEGFRRVLLDDRLTDVTPEEIMHRVLVRFPLGTAMFEELAFRGVLPAVVRRQENGKHADWTAAAAFAIWHLIPTWQTVGANSTGRDLPRSAKLGLTFAGSIGAGLAGIGFSALRSRSGSLTTPWLSHSAFNSLALLAATRLPGRPVTTPSA